jgi:hypothetical protein
LNDTETPPLGLRRFLDADDISRIEFEAELSGFAELLRQSRSHLRQLRKAKYAPPESAPSASHHVAEMPKGNVSAKNRDLDILSGFRNQG